MNPTDQILNSTPTRRSILLAGATIAALTGSVDVAAAAGKGRGKGPTPRRPLRILVDTNEPWGTYHIAAVVAELAAGAIPGRYEVASVVPDRTQLKGGDPVTAVTVDQAPAWGADLLVVNGATDWPVKVAQALSELPIVASSFAYLTSVEAPGAAILRPRIVAYTAASSSEAEVFAAHFGVDASLVQVVGNPKLDDRPAYQPKPGTVLIATSVTKSSVTGGAAPGAQLLLDSAAALAAAGYKIRVGLHPREDASLWQAYEIATEGTTAAAASAEVTVGIPGSVFPNVAAIGCPLVGVVADGLKTPQYILDLCTPARTVDEVLAAVKAKEPPSLDELATAVGPLGGAGERLLAVWRAAATRPRGKAWGRR